MSPDGTGCEGVTNPLGQVYTGHGTDVHRGLVCCDASIILTSLGVNPLGATITELAERSVALVAGQRGLKIDLETSNGDIDTDSRPRFSHPKGSQTEKNKDYVSTEWHFTESLEGYVAVPSLSASYAVAEHVGKGCSSTMRRIPTVEVHRKVPGCTGPIIFRPTIRKPSSFDLIGLTGVFLLYGPKSKN